MKTQKEIRQALEGYFATYPDERDGAALFCDFLSRYDSEQLYDRRNFDGHITAGGVIYDPWRKAVLLLDHLQLRKWLQPGGHVDEGDLSVEAAALREIEEETGITPEMIRMRTHPKTGIHIFDLDSHYIGECGYKNEAEHYHHDIRFLFVTLLPGIDPHLDSTESGGYRWVPLTELPGYFGFGRMKNKLEKFL